MKGKNRNHHKEPNKQAQRKLLQPGNEQGKKAVYPLVSMEATEQLRKGTKSAARARNCRLRPGSSSNLRSHRLTVTGLPGGCSQMEVLICELCPHPDSCVHNFSPWPSLQLSSDQLLLLFNDY